MKTYYLLFIIVLALSACTRQQAEEAIALLPGVGGDEDVAAAVAARDASQCRQIKGKDDTATRNRQIRCFYEVGSKADDTRACMALLEYYAEPDRDTDVKNKVIDCFANIAVNLRDPDLCDQLTAAFGSSERDSCLSLAVPATGDASLCARIENEVFWSMCIAETARQSRNFQTCGNLVDIGSRSRCQWEVAALRGESHLCAEVEREDFRNNCYKELAGQTGDKSLCDKITNANSRQKCQDKP